MAKSFAAAAQAFFGRLPGQTLGEFASELKALRPEQREWYATELSKVLGEDVTPFAGPKA